MQPLVTIICLCYNHKPFVEDAISSVLNQSYSNIEIIIVDDASKDGSKELLQVFTEQHKLPFLNLQKNIGNCAAFNKAWSLAKGKYIIDFATDDVMLLNRVERQVQFFESLPDEFGVVYSNANYINITGNFLYDHFGSENSLMPYHSKFQGNIYAAVLKEFFIPPPTMMIKNRVLEDLGGYDETLAYEDFDFWIRSSRNYKYGYQNECLTKIRKLPRSLSANLYKTSDKQLMSTYRVCLKAHQLNKNEEEHEALIHRLRYEARHAVFTGNYDEGSLFFILLSKNRGMNWASLFFKFIAKLKLPLGKYRQLYLKLRYGKLYSSFF